MATPTPQPVSAAEAMARLEWALVTLAGPAHVELDPLRARALARTATGPRAQFEEPELQALLTEVLHQARLHAVPVTLDATHLELAALPVLTLGGGGLAVLARRGGEFSVATPGQDAEWVPTARAQELVRAQGEVGWLSSSAAAPLDEVAHHPSPWARLRALLGLERDDLGVVAIYAATVGLLTLASPIAVQALVGSVAFGTLLQPIVILSLILLAALSFQAVLRALQAWVVERLQQRAFVRASLDLAWRLPRVRLDEGQHGFGATTLNRFFEVPTIQKALGVLLTDGIAYVLQLSIGMLVLAFYHPFLLAFDLALMALVAAVVWVPLRRGVETSISESYAKHDVAAWLQQLAVPSALFRGRGAATFALERAELLTRRYVHERRRHFRVLFSQTLGVLAIQVVASAALLGLGGWLVLIGELTLGQLVAAELIVTAVAGAVARIGKLLDSTYDLLASLDKLGSVLDVELELPEAEEPIPGTEPVRVELRLEGERPWTLSVKAGERLAIVGARGHVLGEWLTALRVPDHGVVTFNNVEGHRAGLALRDSVALVRARDTFPGSILDNVSVSRPGATAADVRAALERVGLLEEVRSLPRGLDTELFADGAPLDASQRARLSLARAMLNAPRLLVIDGAVDGLSPAEREVVLQALTRPNAPWTLVALVDDPQSPLARACTRTLTLPDFTHPRTS